MYLNEAMRVNVHPSTWLERKRYAEAIARRRQGLGKIEVESLSTSGYARESKNRGADSATPEAAATMGQGEHGVVLAHGQGRWALTTRFLRGILVLLVVIQVRLAVAVLQRLHIAWRPHWFARLSESTRNEESKRRQTNPSLEPGSLLATTGRPDLQFDVETFARNKIQRSGAYEHDPDHAEAHVENFLYNWWKGGGKWGDIDPSDDYAPSTFDDDDTTSVISFSTTSDADEWSDMEEEDGQRTPTQSSFRFSRESTPMQDNALDLARLSHLLDPRSKEDREEARMLGRHLQSSGVLTRSQYRKVLQSNDARLLASPRYRKSGPESMSSEEEEQVLEEFMLDRRDAAAKSTAGTWDSGAEGMGAEGPQCVVCQISPRTVLVWPCGCLSLCDECRVGLASKNYTTCVCCRTNVTSYSRLFVP